MKHTYKEFYGLGCEEEQWQPPKESKYWRYRFLTILFLSFIVAAIITAIFVGVSRQEEVECDNWVSLAKEYPLFYVSQWQADQCQAHNIIIDAPIK